MIDAGEFEAARPNLVAIGFRLLGSVHDAEDAVQTAWLRADGAVDVRNPGAWLTTVVTRICLDQLRARARRGELPLLAEDVPADALTADERYLQREQISRALLLVLDVLTPDQRVAYVLHEAFGLPFREIATVLGCTVDAAKQHASRARRRVAAATPPDTGEADRAVVDAFLTAASGGDVAAMVALMADDCVRSADPSLVPPGVPTTVRGARAVATETARFVDRIRAAVEVVVGGRTVRVIAPGGHPLARLEVRVEDGVVHRIVIARLQLETMVDLGF